MSSLDRLIKLAQKTGDRLIVHNPYANQDVVIMGVDQYEQLALGKKDVRELSSGQLLDQINRDIAIWRANKEMEDRWNSEEMLENEMAEQGPFDPFQEFDSHVPEWHTAKSVIENRYKKNFDLNNIDLDETLDTDEETEFDPEKIEEIKVEDIPNFGLEESEDEDEEGENLEEVLGEEELPLAEIEKPTVAEEENKIQVPFVEQPVGEWKEEPLNDEEGPKFFEEPV